MAKSRDFEVRSIVFCEYVSTDITGKNHNLGIFPLEMTFLATLQTLPQIYINILLLPLTGQFSFMVEFSDPRDRVIFRARCECHSRGKVGSHETITANFQTPPIRFPGDGTYTIKVLNSANEVVHSARLEVATHVPVPGGFELSAQIELGPDFISEFESIETANG